MPTLRTVVHLNVWFSFKDPMGESEQLQRVHVFLLDLQNRRHVDSYRLLKARSGPCDGSQPRFHAQITFRDEDHFARSVKEVTSFGVHSGRHGFMIADVVDFTTAVSEELSESFATNT